MEHLRRHNTDQDLAEEMRLYLEEKTEQFMREGMGRREAGQAARRAFGNSTLLQQRSHEVRRSPTLESVGADVRFAVRHLWKFKAFTVTVVVTIALGVGANTAIFSLAHSVLMKSLPVGDPKSLYRLGNERDCCFSDGMDNDNGEFDLFSYQLYQHLRQSTPEFEQLAAVQASQDAMSVRRGNDAARSEATEYVSGNYFSTLGVGAYSGRELIDSGYKIDAAPAAVI
jgi:macrolide transport system ATP-binding/permease protein